MRIVSLLPSATEIVFALGLGDQLVARTHECDYPPQAKKLPAITHSLAVDPHRHTGLEIDRLIEERLHLGQGIYAIDEELLRRLQPDLILTQELCRVCAVAYTEVQQAARTLDGESKIVSLEPNSVWDILDNIVLVGELTDRQAEAHERVAGLRERIRLVAEMASQVEHRPRVFAMEWIQPPMRSGHWIPEMVELVGGQDTLGNRQRPSSKVSWEEILAEAPEVVVIMPCGFDLARTLREIGRTQYPAGWRELPAARAGRVWATDGNAYFSRPGPRIVESLEILAEIIHPELFRGLIPPGAAKPILF